MILVSGKFDPLHPGHLAYFKAARRIMPGEPLCCAVECDEKLGHPALLSQFDRAVLISGFVDDVCLLPLHEAIRIRRPIMLVKGREWEGQLPASVLMACEDVGCATTFVDVRSHSSTQILADYQARLNAQAVAEFERFVHGQKPAQPWKPVTDYSLEARRKAEGLHPQFIKGVFQPARVLDFGCGPGHLMTMLQELGMDVDGYDLDRPIPFLPHQYDLVICREVLEHVEARDLALAIATLVKASSRFVYVTTRFNAAPKHLLDVQDHDDLDPMHITMLSKDFLRALFVLHGCKSRPDLEERMDWQHKGRCLVFEVV